MVTLSPVIDGDEKMTEIVEMLENIQVADSKTKGYKFHCAGIPNRCRECSKKLVSFVSQDLDEAYKHSKRNSVAMWIAKD